jgi:hypothetical protein
MLKVTCLDGAVLALVKVVRVAVAVLIVLVGDFVRLVSPVAESMHAQK